MVDVLTSEQRSFNMSRIRGRDTKPELTLRRGLHSLGLRFRLHRRDLPGRPDLVFASRRAVVFVHGCFWHGHDCPMCRLPATRPDFWATKIAGNRARDRRCQQQNLASNIAPNLYRIGFQYHNPEKHRSSRRPFPADRYLQLQSKRCSGPGLGACQGSCRTVSAMIYLLPDLLRFRPTVRSCDWW